MAPRGSLPTMSIQLFRRVLTNLGAWTAHPAAFAIVALYGLGWFIFERTAFDWHAVATLAVWLMTLVIQRAEHRDTQAMHAKLDELLVATGGARNELAGIDRRQGEEIETFREEARAIA